MPSCLIYLGIMLAVIIVWFMFVKRPVYELPLSDLKTMIDARGCVL